jgi:Pyruvate/2-oxoacid:ferredoxin oxidoreductase delta subunit
MSGSGVKDDQRKPKGPGLEKVVENEKSAVDCTTSKVVVKPMSRECIAVDCESCVGICGVDVSLSREWSATFNYEACFAKESIE